MKKAPTVFDPENSVFVIAEIGINHNGLISSAKALIDAAYLAGADAVKFQTFRPNDLLKADAPKARYQADVTLVNESQLQLLEKVGLSREAHLELVREANARGLRFMSTAFDSKSLDFLVREMDLPILKIPSGEVTNGPLLFEFGKAKRPIIFSTGMSNLAEVKTALSVIASGLLGLRITTVQGLERVLHDRGVRKVLKEYVTLMHCTTQYPAAFESVNLRALGSLKAEFGLMVGYSDHTQGILISAAAVACGARVIEKHITLDRTLPGPDHAASLEPHEFKNLVDSIRMVEVAMGDGIKKPHLTEIENLEVARKSLVAAHEISAHEKFSAYNLTSKRPGTGKSPMEYWDMLGKKSNRDYDTDEFI